jgi:hypothetical protein
MDALTPATYTAPTEPAILWWHVEAEGWCGQTLRTWASPEKLKAIIAGRRAACSAKMKSLRSRSERGIARLINNGGR